MGILLAATLLVTVQGNTFITDLRYNSDNNFLKKNVYAPFRITTCQVHPGMAATLDKLVLKLQEQHLQLVFWDCHRPIEVQEAMWKIVSDSRYVANPKVGSNHNRGTAIDVTLAYENGSLLPMPTGFDSFTPQAHTTYRCAPADAEKCRNRDLLMGLMKSVGLEGISSEWWHYQLKGAGKYPIAGATHGTP